MTPNVDERLASVVRALTDVILPSLPPEAGLAQEQVHLAIGHLQILRAQLDQIPAFEAEELADAGALAHALLSDITGGLQTAGALSGLRAVVDDAPPATPAEARARRQAINAAIATVVASVSADGNAASRTALRATILSYEKARVLKDRHWFAPFGFDSL